MPDHIKGNFRVLLVKTIYFAIICFHLQFINQDAILFNNFYIYK